MVRVYRLLAAIAAVIALGAAVACTREVIKEVPKEIVVTEEVIKEVPVERVVEREVVKEVPVEVVVEKEVVREVEVPVERVVEKEVVREVEVQVEVEKEVVREVEVFKEVVVGEGEEAASVIELARLQRRHQAVALHGSQRVRQPDRQARLLNPNDGQPA